MKTLPVCRPVVLVYAPCVSTLSEYPEFRCSRSVQMKVFSVRVENIEAIPARCVSVVLHYGIAGAHSMDPS